MRIVTGPSLTSSTRIIAWNSPVATGTLSCPQFSHDAFVQRARLFWRRSRVERRPPPLPDVAIQRELRDDEYATARVGDGSIHVASGFALEDPHLADLRHDVLHVVRAVIAADAEQDEEAGADLPRLAIADAHARFSDPLNDRAHVTAAGSG